ncbi:MAG: hypothetical protein H6621_10680 [Halobacteriovoraceae bacterium]|nr:hypothetical protein [Halobacteriovoraceae bacterium]MCB9095522.1 hypothetical protein [Halobacteriovoraceae bacterium]
MDLSYCEIFFYFVLFTAIQRIGELFWAKRNEKIILAEGGRIIDEKNYFMMVLLHTMWITILLLLAYACREEKISSFNFWVGGSLFIAGQFLRLSAILTLGKRWSTRIVILPNAPVVKKGIFNYVRHPNYLGVVLEIFALPFMGGYWQLALFFSCLNFIVLFFRIKEEERMLCQFNDYAQKFKGKTT